MKALKSQRLEGPNGELVKIAWMPEDRVRFTFPTSGPCVVRWVLSKGNTTNVELGYGDKIKVLG